MGRQHPRQGTALAVAVATAMIVVGSSTLAPLTNSSRDITGSARLVAIQEFPDFGDVCNMEPPGVEPGAPDENLFSAFAEPAAHAAVQSSSETTDVTREPVRTIRDTYPIYSSIAVDTQHDEIALQDTNQFGIKFFPRLENTPRDAEASKPLRVIEGENTDLEYNNGLYIDPKTSEIYSVASDTADNMIVFPYGAQGDLPPARRLRTPHRNFATAVDEEKSEVFITIQYPPKVVVYHKQASGDDKPIRILEGPRTGLADAHGLAIDVKTRLMFVGNWTAVSDYKSAGTGTFQQPSIRVFPLDANGDVAPLRVIQGPKTRLNWAAAMAIDPGAGMLYVANDVGHEILVFRETDNGDVAPTRTLKGPKTGISNPTGVALDLTNREIWVSNLGTSSASAFPLSANGDVSPIRTIRSAPLGRKSVKFGKPQAVAYDSKRQEYLVPN
jgi:6-phosphogluconolactonase (cycloisomerase 2 family)